MHIPKCKETVISSFNRPVRALDFPGSEEKPFFYVATSSYSLGSLSPHSFNNIIMSPPPSTSSSSFIRDDGGGIDVFDVHTYSKLHYWKAISDNSHPAGVQSMLTTEYQNYCCSCAVANV